MKKTNIAILSTILISTFILTLPVYAKSVVQNHKAQIQGPYITLPSSPKPSKEFFKQGNDNSPDFFNDLVDFCTTQMDGCEDGCINENDLTTQSEYEDCMSGCSDDFFDCLGY